MSDIILFGPPGGGKGTQAALLKGYRHVSTGNLFRQAVVDQTELGKEIESILGTGGLVPDDITMRVVESVCAEHRPIVWDGFPRTIEQAHSFNLVLARYGREIAHVIDLSVPDNVLLARIIARGESSGRADDNAETFRKRLSLYNEQAEQILYYYADWVTTLDGTESTEVVAAKIAEVIA